MVDVNIHINEAILDTFSLRNLDLRKIETIKKRYAFRVGKRKERNKKIMLDKKESVRDYLLTFAPNNLKRCKMYLNN